MHEEELELNELLKRRAEESANQAEIDAQIKDKFERECTVMVSDLSSFSKLTHEHGIIHTLGLIAKAHEIAAPILKALGGEVLRADHESLVVLFNKPMEAVMAARAVNRAFEEYNSKVSPENALAISLGIGHGNVIKVGDKVYGDQVNQAARLGEDVEGKCEVKLTPEAYEGVKHLQSLNFRQSAPVQLGGLEIQPYELIFT